MRALDHTKATETVKRGETTGRGVAQEEGTKEATSDQQEKATQP